MYMENIWLENYVKYVDVRFIEKYCYSGKTYKWLIISSKALFVILFTKSTMKYPSLPSAK